MLSRKTKIAVVQKAVLERVALNTEIAHEHKYKPLHRDSSQLQSVREEASQEQRKCLYKTQMRVGRLHGCLWTLLSAYEN